MFVPPVRKLVGKVHCEGDVTANPVQVKVENEEPISLSEPVATSCVNEDGGEHRRWWANMWVPGRPFLITDHVGDHDDCGFPPENADRDPVDLLNEMRNVV